ncbi:hypothetical protein BH10PAT2_BH10PAT2_3540 [soil metagenome]
MEKRLIVTHHAPDLDAIGSVWMLKRFDFQHYADSQESFVDPGTQIDPSEAERLGFQMHQVTHVDTGLGQFDHHQTERGHERVCATSLVFDYVCRLHPEYKNNEALLYIVEFATQIDHFEEIYWPDASSPMNCFMINELIGGFESTGLHDDDSQLQFGMHCLDAAYAALKETFQARDSIKEGTAFQIKVGKALGIESKNDQVIKFAQKAGFMLVVKKNPEDGAMRIKVRPDADLDLKALHEKILKKDTTGTWYYHASGKMLLNGSKKHRHQRPTPLTLNEVIEMIKEIY